MISIALPIHDMKDAPLFLRRCLDSIAIQSYKDFEVVITDNSPDDRLYKIIATYDFKVNYSLNTRIGMAQNTNEAIKLSKGEYIKILYMDDYLAHKYALKDVVKAFKGSFMDMAFASHANFWVVTAANNNLNPRYTDDIHKGNNKLGSPSALAIKNENPMLFDEEMTWLLDCDYYKRMHEEYGLPKIVKKVGVIMGVGEHQMTHLLTDVEKDLEARYMHNKYPKDYE